jgi:hypothetical protein
LGLIERLLAFTAFPLRPLRRHGVLRGKKLRSGLNDSFLPQSSQRKPQGSQRLELNESQVAFTTFPLRPLRRHGVLRGKKLRSGLNASILWQREPQGS